MKIENIEPMIPNSDKSPINPFLQDYFHMGTPLGKNVLIMHSNHSTSDCPYLIVIDTLTGERIKITF